MPRHPPRSSYMGNYKARIKLQVLAGPNLSCWRRGVNHRQSPIQRMPVSDQANPCHEASPHNFGERNICLTRGQRLQTRSTPKTGSRSRQCFPAELSVAAHPWPRKLHACPACAANRQSTCLRRLAPAEAFHARAPSQRFMNQLHSLRLRLLRPGKS